MAYLDLLYLADLRFPGGTTSALINDLRAARQNGLNVGVLAIQSSALSSRRPPNGNLLHWMRKLDVPLVPLDEPITTPLALIYHPSILNTLPPRRLDIVAQTVGLVAHHPLNNSKGELQFKYPELRRLTEHLLGQQLVVLPVGPKVRDSFLRAESGDHLHARNWNNLISLDDWPEIVPREDTRTLRIGRHARPDWLKWPAPETACLVYPADPAFEYAMLGVDDRLRSAMAPWPSHWSGMPFRKSGVQAFLHSLDVYAYFHHPDWIEAFGYNVLEAMACGLPTILAPDFEQTFGDGALYVSPDAVSDLYHTLRTDPARRKEQGKRGRDFVRENHSYDAFLAQYRTLVPELRPKPKAPRARIVPTRSTKLMIITSNGVGAGHVVRQLSIAKALPLGMEATFFSLSKSVKFAADEGFLAEYRAFHRQTGSEVADWNAWLCDELMEAFAFHAPDAVVFDGNKPYSGLLRALQAYPEISRIWVRRAMWRHADASVDKRADLFHLVVTPGELADASDPGQGIADDPMSQKIAPILSANPAEIFSRQTARRLLDLPPDDLLCLLQLGGSANFDMSAARQTALDVVLSDAQAHVVELVTPARMDRIKKLSDRHHVLTVFPAFLYFRAFDFAIGAAGYNAFHETVAAALPSVFVPNTAGEMDLQETRANYAARAGWALFARADDLYNLTTRIRRICTDPVLRAKMRDRMLSVRLDWSGAQQAADLIAVTALTCPLHRETVVV